MLVPLTALALLAGCSGTAGDAQRGDETSSQSAVTESSSTPTAPESTDGAPTEEPAVGDDGSWPGMAEDRPPMQISWPDDYRGGLRAPGRSLAPRDAGEPLWHTIDRTPKPPPRTRSVAPSGTTLDMDENDVLTERGPDGSLDSWLPGGQHIHVGPDGDFIENKGKGILDSWEPDGTHTHLGPDGNYVERPDGSRSEFDPNDGNWTDFPPLGDLPSSLGGPGGGSGDGPGDGKEPSGAIGEPHYLTEDGADLTTQVLGEFQLTTGVPGHAVQARVEPYLQSEQAAAITALAFGVGDNRVSVYLDGTVLVNGVPAPEGTDLQGDLDGGGVVGVWRDAAGGLETFGILWPDLSLALVHPHNGWLNLTLQWHAAGAGRTGLLGSDDGDAGNDLTGRDGAVAQPDDQAQIDAVARSWRIAAEDSLFTYGDDESPETFAVDDFPKTPAPAVDPDSVPECADVPTVFARAACAYDVTVTGNTEFVESSAAFGTTIAGDALRRMSLADVKAQITKITGGANTFTLSDEDRAGAESSAADTGLALTLADGETHTYRIDLGGGVSVGAFNNDLTCPDEPWRPGQAGYGIFAADGTLVAGPRRACDDLPRSDVLPAGAYYVKLAGPASFDLSLVTYQE